MSRAASHPGERERFPTSTTPTADEVRTENHLILSSPGFPRRKRCQQFLGHVCEKALAGEASALKEKLIAIEIFGRRPDSTGLGEDTIVRVGAREVRERLALHYRVTRVFRVACRTNGYCLSAKGLGSLPSGEISDEKMSILRSGCACSYCICLCPERNGYHRRTRHRFVGCRYPRRDCHC